MRVQSTKLLATMMIHVLLHGVHSSSNSYHSLYHHIYQAVHHKQSPPEKESIITDRRKDIFRPYFWLLKAQYFANSHPEFP